MERLPLTLYDVLACVVAGVVLLIAGDVALGSAQLLQHNLDLTNSVVVVIGAYILGHIIAQLSGFLFEQVAVRGILGSPEDLLLHERRRGPRAVVFPGYFAPLPSRMRAEVLERAKAADLNTDGRDIYSSARQRVRREGETASKLETFLNLYGFCRNTSFALLVAGLLLLVCARATPWRLAGGAHAEAFWGGLVVLAGMILFYRYLKFFRLYTVEVFQAYATTPFAPLAPPDTHDGQDGKGGANDQ